MVIESAPWGLLIAAYLFLGGASGGAFCVAAWAELRRKDLSLAPWAALVSAPAIIVGLLFLIFDLGRPERAFLVFTNMGSVMTWGSIIIVAFTLASCLYLSFWLGVFPWSSSAKLRRTTSLVGLPLALATMIYTGVLVGVLVGRPLWSSALIPALFAISGLSAGIALTAVGPTLFPRAVIAGTGTSDPEASSIAVHRAHKIDVLVILTEVAVLSTLLITISLTSFTGAGSVGVLISGSLSALFWAGLVAIGFGVSIITYVLGSRSKGIRSSRVGIVASALSVLFGGLVLRFLILSSGWSVPIPYLPGFFQSLPPPLTPTYGELAVTAGLFLALAAVYYVGARLFLLTPRQTLSFLKPHVFSKGSSVPKERAG